MWIILCILIRVTWSWTYIILYFICTIIIAGNIGGEFNLVVWWMSGRFIKFNSSKYSAHGDFADLVYTTWPRPHQDCGSLIQNPPIFKNSENDESARYNSRQYFRQWNIEVFFWYNYMYNNICSRWSWYVYMYIVVVWSVHVQFTHFQGGFMHLLPWENWWKT